MKIAFIYGPWSVGQRPFNLDSLWTDPRGLTGSEVSFFSIAREMARRGHQVTIFTRHQSRLPRDWEGCSVLDVDSLSPESTASFDAACSWNEPDMLRRVSPELVRLVNQQLNDFDYCQPGYDEFVDVYTSPSDAHREYIRSHTPIPEKWEVLPNGCDSSQYPDVPRVRNRVIYASSPDRGLHLLLQEWPKIRRAVPDAHLRVFYNFEPWYQRMSVETFSPYPDVRECCHRAMYIREAMRRLADHGVEHCHSISREQMAKEMAEAWVLAYPCETIRYTEGFSVTLMEACASGVLPVTSSVDSLGGIYGKVVPMVQAPARDNMPAFVDLVVKGLKDEKWRSKVVAKTKKFSKSFEWPLLAHRLEKILQPRVTAK